MSETPDDDSGYSTPTTSGVDPHAERISHYEDAAQLAVAGHPLPGEDIASPYLDDAQMWLGVYRELLEFKETLIRDTSRALKTLSAPGREEVGQTDAVILAAEAERFRHRISLWELRFQELSAQSHRADSAVQEPPAAR